MIGALCCFAVVALAAGQEDAADRSERAARAMLAERFGEAETLYRELLREDPDNPGLLLNLGLAEQSLGKLREAAGRFRAVVKLQPETTLAWLLLGAAHRKLGEPAEAIQPLERVLETEPANRAAELELAEALFELGRFEEAATRFFRLVEMENSNPRGWQGLGTCYVKLARRALSELGRGAPDSAFWWALAGRERAEAGRLASAFAFYREALNKEPGLRGVRGAIAEIYSATGHDDWARTEQAREEKLPPPDCGKEAPECELRDQRYWQAVEAAAKLSGPRAVYWKALGYYELARVAFERLAELPLSAERYELLAEAHRLMGRHREAVKMWREALALAPEDRRLVKELARSQVDVLRDDGKARAAPGEIALTDRAAELEAIREDHRSVSRPFRLRPCEWVLIAYFVLAAVRTAPRAQWVWLAAIAIFAGAGSCALARAEARTGRRVFAMARDWLALPFVLIAYWSVDWVRDGAAIHSFQGSWIVLDRFLFRELGLRAAIEFFGPLLPFGLEVCYALLYVLPMAALAALYAGGRRSRAERFLFVLLLGTFATDTLMPLFPSTDPRLRFPGEDLPAYLTAGRALNLWLLNHFDIRASVFPSGHVTTGLSTAFGMWLAWPERKRAGLAFFLIACAVALAAVYGRYHYLADALGGAAVSLAAAGAGALVYRRGSADSAGRASPQPE